MRTIRNFNRSIPEIFIPGTHLEYTACDLPLNIPESYAARIIEALNRTLSDRIENKMYAINRLYKRRSASPNDWKLSLASSWTRPPTKRRRYHASDDSNEEAATELDTSNTEATNNSVKDTLAVQ